MKKELNIKPATNKEYDVYYDGDLILKKVNENYFFCCFNDYGYITKTIGDYLLKKLNNSWIEGYDTLDRIIKLQLYFIK